MEGPELLDVLKRPELVGLQFLVLKGLGALCSALGAIVLFFVKKLIREVKKSTHVNARVAYKLETLSTKMGEHEKNHAELAKSYKDSYKELSQRVHNCEIGIAVIEREILKKKWDNNLTPQNKES